MTLTMDERVTAIVDEMIALGAVFEIDYVTKTWCWQARPPIMQNAIRSFYEDQGERFYTTFNAAMIRAIMRTKFADAP